MAVKELEMQSAKTYPAQVTVPAHQSETRVSPANRMGYIDNLRVFLTILVIVLHVAVTYGSEGGWYYQEPTESMAAIIPLTMLSAILQSFFMGLFFFLAGYFTPGSVDKKGSWKFIVDRLLRLGIPCLIFIYGINPLTNYITVVFIEGGSPGYWTGIRVMWFAQALLLLGVIYALLRVVFRPSAVPKENAPFPTKWQLLLAVVGMASLTFAVRYFYPRGTGMFGMIFGDFPQYVTMFTVGIIAYRNNWLDVIRSVKSKGFVISFGLLIVALPLMMVFGEDPTYGFDLFMGGIHWQAAAYATWESCMVVVISILLLKAFQRRYAAQTNVLVSMASSAYTVYIIHPVFLVVGSYLLHGFDAHPLIKFVILAASSTVTTFAAGNLIRRLPGANRIL